MVRDKRGEGRRGGARGSMRWGREAGKGENENELKCN